MTRFLVVGSGSGLQPRLRSMSPDIQTVVLCRASALELIFGVADNQAVVVLRDDAPVNRWVSAARRIHEEWQVEAIASFSEIDQDKAAHIAEALALPGHSVDTVSCVHDKARMRDRLRRCGLENLPHRAIHTLGELVAFYDAVGPPLILKPSGGRASVGISVIRNRSEISDAYHRTNGAQAPRLDPSTPLAERYVEGPEYSVEALTHQGRHYVFAVTEKFTDPASKVEVGHLVPARIAPDDERRIVNHVDAALSALGVTTGITHTEVILGPDGPVMVETHLRGAGDEIIHLVEDATGDDMMELFLQQTVGVDIGLLPELRSRRDGPHYEAGAAIRYLVSNTHGTLARIDGWEEVAALSGVRDTGQLRKDGVTLDGLHSSRSRLGYVRVREEDPSAAMRLAEAAVDKLTINYERPAG
jgi:biotin carboxylase